MLRISIVVPVYKSAACLSELARRVRAEIGPRFDDYELILVNDASPDESWEVIVRLAKEYAFVTGVNLRKNVGQDSAIMAGIHVAAGDVIVIMDDDLQHSPSDISALHDATTEGFDVVYANFEHKKQALWKNLGSWFNDKCANFVLGKPKNVYMSPFKAIRREVADEIAKYQGPYPYIDGLIFTVTSNITQVPVSHHPRFAGQGNYNLLRSVMVWLKLSTGFSIIPLRMATFLGGVMSLASFALALYFVIEALVMEREPSGWPSVIVAILFIGGIQLIGIGTAGEYIGRIFITQSQRPQFTVRQIYRGLPARKDMAHESEANLRTSDGADATVEIQNGKAEPQHSQSNSY
jgi:undecaprenyl-phosphate 4-deoxy-4-formamido-L-arabinose transferase